MFACLAAEVLPDLEQRLDPGPKPVPDVSTPIRSQIYTHSETGS